MSSRGALYLVWGDLHPLLERSIASLKKWHPDLPVHVVELPADSTYLDKATMVERSPFDTTAYLDADTIVMGSLDYAFEKAEQFGLACCINEAPWARRYASLDGDSIEYNAGVMFFDKVRFGPTAQAWRACAGSIDSSCVYIDQRTGEKKRQLVNDQAGLTKAIEDTGFNPHVLPLNWNFKPDYHRSFVGPIKIWHDYKEPHPELISHSTREADARVMGALYTEAEEPPEEGHKRLHVACAMSVPRLGFMDNFFCWVNGLMGLGIKPQIHTGVYWGQCLELTMEEQLDADYILTVDYDSVFVKEDVQALLQLAADHPEADAIVPLQQRRNFLSPLFTIADENGDAIRQIPGELLGQALMKVTTAHFGLTLLSTAALKRMSHPWFHSIPDEHGRWNGSHIDEDVAFWKKWAEVGNSVYVANRVPIGHIETMVTWPDKQMRSIHQSASEFNKTGKPAEVWR